MDVQLFDYDLPAERIAQAPAQRRDASRLMVVRRGTQSVEHAHFADLPSFLPPRTRLIRNNVSVLKARLHGHRETGGAVECLLLHPGTDPTQWWCLLKPGKKLPVGAVFRLPEGGRAHVHERRNDGQSLVAFQLPGGEGVTDFATRHGEVPLPPYIQREHALPEDEARYQTLYADPAQKRAVAAPTAGLHFTPELDARLLAEGHSLLSLTLHVGLGTFRPIQVDRVEEHEMHSESYSIPVDTLAALRDATAPRLCVGTTSLRASEDYLRKAAAAESPAAMAGSSVSAFASSASLFIRPPDSFHIDHLITNFHLPRSTLMCLVSAFLTPGSTEGIPWLKALYAEAIALRYRFYSYGDAMIIV